MDLPVDMRWAIKCHQTSVKKSEEKSEMALMAVAEQTGVSDVTSHQPLFQNRQHHKKKT
jgi:hypothetical protein